MNIPSQAGRMDIEIETLRLYGFSTVDRYRIAEALVVELKRLFVEQGVPPALLVNGEAASLEAGEIGLLPDARPEQLGSRLAQTIYNCFVNSQ